MKKIIYWLPRILAIIIILSWFSFVFFTYGLSQASLLKSGIWIALIFITILAWRGQIIGKVAFIILGFLYLIVAWGKFTLDVYILVAVPLWLNGILFLLEKPTAKIHYEKKISGIISLKPKKITAENDDKRLI